MYTNMHPGALTCIYRHTHAYTHTDTPVYIHICTSKPTHEHTNVHTHVYIHIARNIEIHTYTYMQKNIQRWTYTHYTCNYIHFHIQMQTTDHRDTHNSHIDTRTFT